MAFPARRFRSLTSSEAPISPALAGLGAALQFLVIHDDQAWMETLAGIVHKRVLNVLEMEADRTRPE